MTDYHWRPSHPYVPGRTARHAEDLFDFIKACIGDCRVEELPESSAWQYALAFHSDGYFWEAHEILEAVWMACPPNSAEKVYVQALIQQSNAALKTAMGQPRAASRLAAEVECLMSEARRRSGGNLFGSRIHI